MQEFSWWYTQEFMVVRHLSAERLVVGHGYIQVWLPNAVSPAEEIIHDVHYFAVVVLVVGG